VRETGEWDLSQFSFFRNWDSAGLIPSSFSKSGFSRLQFLSKIQIEPAQSIFLVGKNIDLFLLENAEMASLAPAKPTTNLNAKYARQLD